MTRYCLDTNVFIQAKNGPYGMDFCPGFWSWLDQQTTSGVLFSSTLVYGELIDGKDDLADWVKERRDGALFIAPTEAVQTFFPQIADYVTKTYKAQQANPFLEDADPWVIAHAKIENAIVVTQETLVPSVSSQVKIPNICNQFGVKWIDLYAMLRELKAQLILKA